ncbi:MAG: formyltetrahydrofolate deformylase [Chromatiaceae bacterium]|nr:formyltetrahydrofolate deformylase [Gammaproteobacteria bacterium]MCB1871457.1 formyltetrahydrofolate deformylase [Gammaproteobacteria bacterium]MCP5426893.1 formyltetrahydrofolate deformylase [Chromatiaceae bacterium]MCP5446688.1 formyltetrahydrofolate deformylase [Chromatiaceae bacterium]
MKPIYRLILDCPDRVGIVTCAAEFITRHNGWILEASHHSEEETNWFFSRIVVDANSLPFGLDGFRSEFTTIAREFKMNWRIVDKSIPKRVVMLVSKESHCLSDLLDRWRNRDIDCEIPCIISNHEDLRGLVEWYGIPFHHVPVTKANKPEAFRQMVELIEKHNADTIVLARYMQILPAWVCERYPNRILNIHHSFLPSFVGARPYHQASTRGVKLIGATCHYVTADLDEGPIIDQDVVRVSHSDTVRDLVRLGKDVEKVVLARSLRDHVEDRVMVHGNKTIVFK